MAAKNTYDAGSIAVLEGLEAVRINTCESRRRQEVKSAGIRRSEHRIVMDDIWKNDPEISGLHVIKCFADPELQCPISYIDTLDGFVNMGRIMDGSFFIDFHSVLFQFAEKVHKADPPSCKIWLVYLFF